jgi:hypothetical protein
MESGFLLSEKRIINMEKQGWKKTLWFWFGIVNVGMESWF